MTRKSSHPAYAARLRLGGALGVALLFQMGGLRAEEVQEQSLAQMDHKSWTARDGAPQAIHALAQGTDGTLWIGSDSGLFSFDGRAFTPYRSPPGEPEFPVEAVRTLCVARDGTLWVGFFQAGVARIRRDHVTLYAKVGEKRLTHIDHLRDASDGSIWGVSRQEVLVRFGPDQQWHEEPPPLNTGDRIFAILDSTDTLWVTQAGRLYRRDIHESRYTVTTTRADVLFDLAEVPDGTLWITDFDGEANDARLQHIDRQGRFINRVPRAAWPAWPADEIIYRPDGSLVYGSQGDGLVLYSRRQLGDSRPLRSALRPEAFTEQHGLSSNALHALLRDTDGTLWVGGQAGLDRFRTGSFVPFVTENEAGDWALCASDRGEVWILHEGVSLHRISGGKTRVIAHAASAYAVSCDSVGDAWVAHPKGAWQVRGDRLIDVPPIPGVSSFGLLEIVAASDHTLYARVGGSKAEGAGIWEYKEHRWTRFSGPGVLSKAGLILYLDRQDRLWAARNDLITRPTVSGGETFSAPGLGLVYAFLDSPRNFFAVGVNGLAVRRGPRFEMLLFEDRGSVTGLNGLAEARNGDLWLNGSRGIVRVPAKELQAALASPAHRMTSELVTEGNFAGLTLTDVRAITAARDADGNLWFATRNGVFHLDPEHRRSDIRPPIVSIRSITADRLPLGAARAFAPHPQTLEIHYFGTHLTDPDRVTYRYRLAGFDNSWQEAGGRTEAFYTNLPPGTYTFQVIASSGNDAWTAPLSSPEFTVLPGFYQTIWFRLLVFAAAIALLFGIFTLRLRAVTRSVRARAEERADERIRIARELHDTLLQGIQGLLLNFHVAAQKIAADNSSRAMLERTLATADRIILEGRNRVTSLRSEQMTDEELAAALENAGRDLAVVEGVEFKVVRSGSSAKLLTHVADEIFVIAREALTNAYRHSGASHIRIELKYGRRYFSMTCSDDGRGFDESAEKQGHWGLRGMAERARKLGGRLRARSESGHGAEIIASVPSYRAYQRSSQLIFWLGALSFSERDPAR